MGCFALVRKLQELRRGGTIVRLADDILRIRLDDISEPALLRAAAKHNASSRGSHASTLAEPQSARRSISAGLPSRQSLLVYPLFIYFFFFLLFFASDLGTLHAPPIRHWGLQTRCEGTEMPSQVKSAMEHLQRSSGPAFGLRSNGHASYGVRVPAHANQADQDLELDLDDHSTAAVRLKAAAVAETSLTHLGTALKALQRDLRDFGSESGEIAPPSTPPANTRQLEALLPTEAHSGELDLCVR
jgi:hypothetical protein